jgi:uncharacterized membrane protein
MRLVNASLIRLGPASPDGPPPLDPSAENARQQLAHELAGPQYTAARPGVFDFIIQKIEDWFNSLFGNAGGLVIGGLWLIILVIIVVVVAAAVVAFFVFGLPSINRRSASNGALFGEEDDRDSTALRRAAERAAADGDFATAIEEGFRAIARGLSERVIVTTFPGTTAHSFAIEAARPFPAYGRPLADAANIFDSVRYLGAEGRDDEWLTVRALEADLRAAKPLLETVDA